LLNVGGLLVAVSKLEEAFLKLGGDCDVEKQFRTLETSEVFTLFFKTVEKLKLFKTRRLQCGRHGVNLER
jgi:hypothetical protein